MKIRIFFILLFLTSMSDAVENPGLFPIGIRESLTGNTGIAGSHSTGAILYNPAALVDLEGLNLSVSGSAYLTYKVKVEPFVVVDSTQLNFEGSGFTAIPSSAVSTFNVGERVTVAAGILIPEALVFSDHQKFTTPNTETDLIVYEEDQDMRLGVGVGIKKNEDFSYGFSLFVSRNTCMAQSTTRSISTTTANTVETLQFYEDAVTTSLLLSAGARWKLSDDLSLGATLKFPMLRLSGSAEVLALNTSVASGVVTESRLEEPDATAFRRSPFDLGLGLGWKASATVNLLFDLSVQAPITFDELPLLSEVTQTKLTPRFNLGTQIMVSQPVTLCAGAFYNPSTLKGDPTEALEQGNSFLGLTFGIEYSSGRTRTSLGGYFAKASDEADISGVTSKNEVQLLSALLGFTYFL